MRGKMLIGPIYANTAGNYEVNRTPLILERFLTACHTVSFFEKKQISIKLTFCEVYTAVAMISNIELGYW